MSEQLRVVCTGAGKHSSAEIELLTRGVDDDGRAWLFGRAVSDARSRVQAPRRTTPQRPIYEDEVQAWRFACPRCGLDIQLPNGAVVEMFLRLAGGEPVDMSG